MHQGDLVRDLAVMLITAGVITIVFRKLRQPLILGYLVAGFITGPYFPAFMDVEDMGSIEIWSEIGVIILMFHIGMEFNVHKLARMGVTPIVSAIVKMGGMLAVGYILGTAMGYSTISSIFLGGMLSISSTAVIQKSFDELNVKKEKYAGFVMGSLIIEDIAGVFMLVVLSTISVSQNVQTGELAAQLMLMVCYLIAWLILGIFLMPSFLNRAVKFMNEEMMNVISLGFCFGMVMIARALGFSSELGAFL